MSTKLNVLKHVMVPDHQLMSEEEVSALLSRYHILRNNYQKFTMTILLSNLSMQKSMM